MSEARRAAFRQRLRSKELLLGSFVKTTSPQVVEVLGLSPLDFVVLDAEHAPFGPSELDLCALAARYVDLPALVRIPRHDSVAIQQTLDIGCHGVVVPRVVAPEVAREAVMASRYVQGQRGYSNSPRAGRYGMSRMSEHLAQQDALAVVVCQVEHQDAVARIEELCDVQDLDGILVGRADLAVSLGCSQLDAEPVRHAVHHVGATARAKGVTAGIFLSDAAEVPAYQALGYSFFVLGSDQSLLMRAAREQVQAARGS